MDGNDADHRTRLGRKALGAGRTWWGRKAMGAGRTRRGSKIPQDSRALRSRKARQGSRIPWGRRTLLPAALLAAGILLAFSLPAMSRRRQEFDPNAVIGSRAAPADQQDMLEELQSQADEKSLRVKINARPVFGPDGAGDLLLQNPLENTKSLQAAIILDGTGQEIYRSAVLPPGGQELRVALSAVPPPGSYKAAARISAIDPATGEAAGGMTAELLITVEGPPAP